MGPSDVAVFVVPLPLLVLGARWVIQADDQLWRDLQLICLGVLHATLLIRSRMPCISFGFACAASSPRTGPSKRR